MNTTPLGIVFDNSYAQLPAEFYAKLAPTPVANPQLVAFNRPLAVQLGIASTIATDVLAQVFAGNLLPQGAEPIAQAYAGHQFGHFVPQLGDGRALLLGEVIDTQGTRYDLQLKGAGKTPFSRAGDGRAPLGAVVREYVLSEAMHTLGVPTTRALAIATTGEPVFRQGALPGAVLARVAKSHARVGTFEYFFARGDLAGLRTLADHIIAQYYPICAEADNRYLALLAQVGQRQAALIAQWLHIGFIHGVMNTDNSSIVGETIDYGPCAFMESYDPATKLSSIDHQGRYAYGNQRALGQWNLSLLAHCLSPLIDPDPTQGQAMADEIVQDYAAQSQALWLKGMRAKLGLLTEQPEDEALIAAWLDCLQRQAADYTTAFRYLAHTLDPDWHHPQLLQYSALRTDDSDWQTWHAQWRQRLQQEPRAPVAIYRQMQLCNPLFIARNHRVEQAIAAALVSDFAPMEKLIQVLQQPYLDQPHNLEYARPASAPERVLQTFCGT